jgi:hypothetical protein
MEPDTEDQNRREMDRLFNFAGITDLQKGRQLPPIKNSSTTTRDPVPTKPPLPNITTLPPIKNPPMLITEKMLNKRVPLPPIKPLLPPISNGGRRRSKKSDTTKKSKTKSRSKSRSRISMKRKNKTHNYRKSRK